MTVINLHQNPDPTPISVEAEQQVLGALLLNGEDVSRVEPFGGASIFYDPCHAEMYRIIAQRVRDGVLVSPVALSEWAKGHEGMKQLGGPGYLARLAAASISAFALDDYCDLLADLKAKRDLLDAMGAAKSALERGEDSASIVSGRLEAALVALDARSGAKPVTMTAATHKAVQEAWAAREGVEVNAVHSGIGALDRIISGFYPGELIILGGRPSMGKTAVALSMALNVARAGHGVVICSLEMNPEAMALRAISEATARRSKAMSYAAMRRGEIPDLALETFTESAREVSQLPITFLPRQFSDVGALFAGAKQARRILGDNMKLLIVDYMQLLSAKAANRYEEITKISMALKALAGQLNVPVLALSQLSRAVEQREEKRPMLSDLRESGQLEQDADAVMFCYRDEYYLEREEPDRGDVDRHEAWQGAMNARRNRLEIIVAKQRQGAIGTAHVRCNPALNLIWEDGR